MNRTLEKILTLLRHDPTMATAVAAELRRIRLAEADQQRAAIEKAATAAVAQMVDRLGEIEQAIDGIRKADAQRRYLNLCNKHSYINGSVHTDYGAIQREMAEEHNGFAH